MAVSDMVWRSVIMLALLCCEVVWADDTRYENYDSNAYILSMPLDEHNIEGLDKRLSSLRFYRIYIPATALTSPERARIAIGFFSDADRAGQIAALSRRYFNGLVVERISQPEHVSVTRQQASVLILNGNDAVRETTARMLLDAARNHYRNRDYQKAASLYRIIRAVAPTASALWAQELLGLCEERQGLWVKAGETYADLLQRAPDYTGAARVKQRLRAVETAASAGQAPLRASEYGDSKVFGRALIGQYYRTVQRRTNGGDSEDSLSMLSTDWDLRGGGQWGDHDVRTRINGYWLEDQLDAEHSRVHLTRAYLDYHHSPSGGGLVVGRQKNPDTGMFTSFDGLTLDYALTHEVNVAISGGSPVYFSDTLDDYSYQFYSAHIDWQANDSWRLGSYFLNQTLNGVTDRQALGLRTSYLKEGLSSTLLVDYDMAFSEVNSLLWNANWDLTSNTRVSGMLGHQRSPFLSASNILIGQADLDLDAYLSVKENQDSLIEDALARTSLSDYYALTVSHQTSENVWVAIDYFSSSLTDVPDFERLAGLPSTGTAISSFDYSSLGLQLQVNSMFMVNDSASAGVRKFSSSTSDALQFYLQCRFRFLDQWYVAPKLSLMQSEFVASSETQNQLRYSLMLNYRPWRNIEFSLEAGNESLSQQLSGVDFESQYLFAGYRMSF